MSTQPAQPDEITTENGYITLPAAAKHIGISFSNAKKLAQSGKFPGAFKIGRLWRVNPDRLRDLDTKAQEAGI
jgi:hypothetical protein